MARITRHRAYLVHQLVVDVFIRYAVQCGGYQCVWWRKSECKMAHFVPSYFYAFADALAAALIDIGGNCDQMILQQAGLAAALVARVANVYHGK